MRLKIKKAVAVMLSVTFICSTMTPTINTTKLVKPTLIADAASSSVSFDETTGTLTLSGNVVKEEVQAWAGNQNVKKVTCAEGTVLPADCSYLFRRIDWRYTSYFYAEELDFSNADTSNVTNMQGMFCGFDNLIHIDLTGFDTSNVTNMANMFGSCDNLEYVDLTGFDTANVTDMSDMFVYCKSLKELDLSSFDTSNVTEMPFMFCNCENMEYLDLKTFNFENVTSMKWMFTNCYKLKNIYFDNDIDTSNVINMDSLFHSCFELQSLDLTSFNTRNVTEMEGMFCNCISLPDLDLCSFDTSNVTNMDSMFCSCTGLEAIYGLDHFDTCNVKSMRWMFSGCRLLESLDLSSFDTSNVNNMEAMFCSCKSIRELDLSTFDTSTVIYMGDMFSYCDSLTTIFVSDKWTTKSLILDDRYHDESEIFLDDKNLVGGNGTSYDSSRVGHEMAHIDTTEAPGYLSSIKANVNVNDGIYFLESAVAKDMVADVENRETYDGCNLQILKRDNSAAQAFRITSVGNGYYAIQLAMTDDKVLSAEGGIGFPGCNVIISNYNGYNVKDDQLWSFENAGDGYYYIKSKTGYYLDVSGGYSENNTNIQLYTGNKTFAQRWKLDKHYDVMKAITYAQTWTEESEDKKEAMSDLLSSLESSLISDSLNNGSDALARKIISMTIEKYREKIIEAVQYTGKYNPKYNRYVKNAMTLPQRLDESIAYKIIQGMLGIMPLIILADDKWGSDCANFVSQCLYEGGGWIETTQWAPVYHGETYEANSPQETWVSADNLYNYLTNLGYKAEPVKEDLSNIHLGDVVFTGQGHHATICTKVTDEKPAYCAHSKWRKNYNYTYDGFKNGYVIDMSFSTYKTVN